MKTASNEVTVLGHHCARVLVFFMGLSASSLLADQSMLIEEIVVTASKQETNLQDLPMSVSVIDDLALERMGATGLLDYFSKAPNLGLAYPSAGRFESGVPVIRGVFGAGTTGMYIDETPVPATTNPLVLDVERVEVLRGPQGSLYGAGSIGGTVRFITRQPSFDGNSASVHARLSSVEEGDENWALDGSANYVASEQLAVRVNGYTGANSGIFDRVHRTDFSVSGTSPFPDRDNIDDSTFSGFGASAKWLINDSISFLPRVLYQQADTDGLPFADREPENMTQPRYFDIEEPGEDEWILGGGTINWQFQTGTLTSTTTRFERDVEETEEQTAFLDFLFNVIIGIPARPFYAPVTIETDYDSTSHETRFVSELAGRWQFIAGIFYRDDRYFFNFLPSYAEGASETGIVPGDLIFVGEFEFESREYAGYGEISFTPNDLLKVTVGGRWYSTETEVAFNADGFASGGPVNTSGSQSESGFNPRALVEVVTSENWLVYGSASSGFRLGGSNLAIPDTFCGPDLASLGLSASDVQDYDTDELWSYELGAKGILAGQRLTLNTSIFRIDWDDIQQSVALACGYTFTANAGSARIDGIEVELSGVLMPGLTVDLGIGYTDSRITDTENVPGSEKGDRIQGSPDWTITSTVEYTFPIGSDIDAYLRADYTYYGDSYSATNEPSAATQRLREAWKALDFRAGVTRDAWDVSLFVKNALDERANLGDNRSHAAETITRPRLVTNRPRTVGIDLRYRF
jgi:outer membrane receptor protein involved in Fe transport